MIKVEEKEIKFPPEKKVWLGDRQSKCALVNLFSGPIIGLFTPRTHSLLRTRPVISERSANNCGVLSPTFGANHTHVCELAPNVGGRPRARCFETLHTPLLIYCQTPTEEATHTHVRTHEAAAGGGGGRKKQPLNPGAVTFVIVPALPPFTNENKTTGAKFLLSLLPTLLPEWPPKKRASDGNERILVKGRREREHIFPSTFWQQHSRDPRPTLACLLVYFW